MFPFTYELGVEGLEVKLGPWVVRRIYYSDMTGAERGYPFWNEHWSNFWPWEFITIRRKSGLIKNFVINPPERDNFLNELRLRIGGNQGR